MAAAGLAAQEAVCPLCETPREPGQRYCEECAYDFLTRTVPAGREHPAPPLITQPTPPPAPPSTPSSPPGVPERPEPPAGVAATWLAEVVPDRAYFDRGDDGSVPFPTDTPPRLVALLGSRTLIGRRSRSRGIFPEIDLSLPPEDIGISRAHALLEHPPGGPLTVTDLGSANGTWLGDSLRRVERGVAVELAAGARIYLGSWTRITLRAR
ncbi:hypothetical protein BL253_33015 [Pseudofrankia asymbiotica]|uniref:FHA domain-containing protein n=1 Tax=Pseudofrankia asymbiotica TaxID=1834516 RepID=A0A1V2I252_9ACTN|nr:hypothetical protein BL253_33015 [Pseudofrankia asymbiotica]